MFLIFIYSKVLVFQGKKKQLCCNQGFLVYFATCVIGPGSLISSVLRLYILPSSSKCFPSAS